MSFSIANESHSEKLVRCTNEQGTIGCHWRGMGAFLNGSIFTREFKSNNWVPISRHGFSQVGALTNGSHLTRNVQIFNCVPLTWHWSSIIWSLFLLHVRLAYGSLWSMSDKLNWVQISKHVIPQVGLYSYRITRTSLSLRRAVVTGTHFLQAVPRLVILRY